MQLGEKTDRYLWSLYLNYYYYLDRHPPSSDSALFWKSENQMDRGNDTLTSAYAYAFHSVSVSFSFSRMMCIDIFNFTTFTPSFSLKYKQHHELYSVMMTTTRRGRFSKKRREWQRQGQLWYHIDSSPCCFTDSLYLCLLCEKRS